MTMLRQYIKLLSPERQQAFEILKKFRDQFVLAGGTAMMLQLGHRLSFDFDCFSEKELPANLLVKIKRVFGASVLIKVKTEEMIILKTSSGVDISFVWHPYKPLRPARETGTISLFHLDDLVANKAYTVGRRNTWRDYIDLFYVMYKKLYSVEKIIRLAEKKFGGEFNTKLFLGQLTYFKDLEIVPINFVKTEYSPSQIQSFLGKITDEYLKDSRII